MNKSKCVLSLFTLNVFLFAHLRIFVALFIMQFESIRIQFGVTDLPGEAECTRVFLQLTLKNQIRRFLVDVNIILFEFRSTFLFDFIGFLIDRVKNRF